VVGNAILIGMTVHAEELNFDRLQIFNSLCHQTRTDVVKMFIESNGGHLGSALSIVDILVTLFDFEMTSNQNPRLRDRFILSKGHGCLALYAVLGRLDYFSRQEWSRIGEPGGLLGGHPTRGKIPGIEITTGSLGLGPSVAVGMATYAKIYQQDYRTYCVIGDGECNEGSVWEAAMSAAQKNLNNICFIIDCNGQQAYGKTEEVCNLEPFADKWRSFGFETHELDLFSNRSALLTFFSGRPRLGTRPLAVICRTAKGMGVRDVENNPAWHNKSSLTAEEKILLLRDFTT
jgi:transketolase